MLQHVATHFVSLQGVLQRLATEASALCNMLQLLLQHSHHCE